MRWMWTVTFPLITSGQTGVKTVADLKGKVVGISDPSGGDVPAVEAYLRSAGLEPRVNVDFLAVGEEVPSIMQAFKDGKIAAYSSGWESNVSFRAAGFDLVDLTPNQFKTLPSEDIVVPTKLAQNDPKVVAGITRAIAKGMLFGLEHPEATLALMKEVAPEEHTDLAYVWLYMAGAQASVLPTQKDGKYYFGAHSMPDWKNFAETLKASVGQVNVEPYLTEDFVQETNNFDYAKVVKDGADYAAAHPYPKKP
jgi:NitT/TauT family transport system substrate-binding protein